MRGKFKGTIVVSNLPDDFRDEDLAALFDDHGLVLGARINHGHPDPVQARRGLVALAPPDRVENAIRAVNGTRIGEWKLKVRRAPEEKPRETVKVRAASPARPSAPPAPASGPQPERRKPVVEYRPIGRGRSFTRPAPGPGRSS
jgi:RNA recognition motif-containing protein